MVSAFAWATPIVEDMDPVKRGGFQDSEVFCISPSPNESDDSSDGDAEGQQDTTPLWHSRTFLSMVRMYNHRFSTSSANFEQEEQIPHAHMRAQEHFRSPPTLKARLVKTCSDSGVHNNLPGTRLVATCCRGTQ